jgi:DNA-directed RNA polymerase specialized sigma24 family protein
LLRAFHLERRPVAEIAAAMGTSERAIEGRLRRARQRLRREIESDPRATGESYDY